MSRYLVLLGLHFLVNFGLLPDNVVASHPVHHDDYTNLAATFETFGLPTPRPFSTLAIAAIATMGDAWAYVILNLLVVGCVFLCIRFVELFVRGGVRLPAAGFVAAGATALSFSGIVDWTKYLGLLTNLTSALPGLGALCAIAAADLDARRARALGAVAIVLAATSFLAKEDFALPLLVVCAAIAIGRRDRRWAGMTVALAALYTAALLFNRSVGSVFVTGMAASTDPYFIDLSPRSLVSALGRMLLASTHGRLVLAAAIVATLAAVIVHRRDRAAGLKLAALPAAAIAVLGPYSIFPNHAFAYYGFTTIALLSATIVAAVYAVAARRA